MKRNNKIIIGIILVITIVILGAGSYSFMKNKQFENYMVNVDKLIQEGKFDEAETNLINAKKLKYNDLVTEKEQLLDLNKTQNKIYTDALALIDKKDYIKAIDQLKQVDPKASDIKNKADSKINECKETLIKSNLEESTKFLGNNEFDKAYSCINTILSLDKENKAALDFKQQIDNNKAVYEENEKKIAQTNAEQKNIITLDKAIEMALNATKDYYKNHNLEEKLKQNGGNVMIYSSDIKEETLEGKEGYTIPRGESYPDHNVRVGLLFLDKNTGEIWELNEAQYNKNN